MADADQALESGDSVPEDRLVQLLWDYDESLSVGPPMAADSSACLGFDLAGDSLERWEQDRAAIDLLSWAGPKMAAASKVGQDQTLAGRLFPTENGPGNNGSFHPAVASPADAPAEFVGVVELPRRLGRFEIVRELGRGGLGVVLLANDPVLKRKVALKIPRPEALLTPDLRQRFAREGQAAGRLTHPNLIAVYEVGDVGPIAYIAAAYCNGPNLSEWLASCKKPVPARTAAEIVAQLADGIEYAHDQGVLHRDLKPSNVVLEMHERAESAPHVAPADDADLPFTPKITDFGLARIEDTSGHETRAGLVMGTPAYMAPEQAEGRVDQIGCQTDVYALGTILYELLADQPAFSGSSDLDTLRRVMHEEPTAPRRLLSGVPRDLEAICLKCLQKQPAKRYPAAGALAADVRRFLAGKPTQARPPSAVERVLKWSRRRPALAALVGVVVSAAVGIVAMSAIYIERLQQANEAAETSRAAAEASATQSQIQERIANEYLYASRMRLAYQSLDHRDTPQAIAPVDQYGPGKPLENLRGFEWHYLKRRLRGERLTLTGHRGEVYAVIFSPDGRLLLSGGDDGTIRVWDPQSGQALKTIAAHASCVNVLDYSPDGAILASASCDHTIKLWDAATLELLGTLEGHTNEVHCLAFCPNHSGWLAAGGHEPLVRIWDLATREIVRTFTAGGDVNGLAWRPDGKELFVAGGILNKDQCHAWRIEDDHVETFSWGAGAVAVSPSGDVDWGLKDALVHVPSAPGSLPLMLPSHGGHVRAVTFSPRGKRMASGGSEHTIHIWDATTRACTQILTGHTRWIQALAFSPSGSLLASASFDGTIRLWNDEPTDRTLRTAEFTHLLLDGPVAISSDFRYLALPSRPDVVSVLGLADGSLLGELPLVGFPRWLQFHPERPNLFVVSSMSGSPGEEWDVEKMQRIKQHRLPDGMIYGAALWGRYLVTEEGGRTAFTDTSTGQIWHQLLRPSPVGQPYINPSTLVASPNGASLLIARREQEPSWIFEAPNGRPPRQTIPWGKALSNGAKVVAREISSYLIVLVDSLTGNQLATLSHHDRIGPAAFSPDGKTLAVCSGDRTVYLWNVATGQELARLTTRPMRSISLQFSSDGLRLAAVGLVDQKTLDADHAYHDGTRILAIEQATAVITIWSGIEGP